MEQKYRKEEVIHIDRVPARIIHQMLTGLECYCPLHWHKDIEINLFLRNPADFLVNGVSRHMEAGDFILINSGDLHSGLGDPGHSEAERSQELLTLQLDYDFLKSYCGGEGAMRFRDTMSADVYDRIRGILLEIGKIHLQEPEFYEIRMTTLILQLGTILLEQCLDRSSKADDPGSRRTFHQIKEAVEYIDAHYAEEMTLNDIAAVMGWAPTYFSRKFRQLTGVTYHDYLCSVRLKHAMDDLLCRDADITEIAFDCGFPNVKSFIEAFRKTFGATPQKYRSAVRKRNGAERNTEEVPCPRS